MFLASDIQAPLTVSTGLQLSAGKAWSVGLDVLADILHKLDELIHLLVILGIERKRGLAHAVRRKDATADQTALVHPDDQLQMLHGESNVGQHPIKESLSFRGSASAV